MTGAPDDEKVFDTKYKKIRQHNRVYLLPYRRQNGQHVSAIKWPSSGPIQGDVEQYRVTHTNGIPLAFTNNRVDVPDDKNMGIKSGGARDM